MVDRIALPILIIEKRKMSAGSGFGTKDGKNE